MKNKLMERQGEIITALNSSQVFVKTTDGRDVT